MPGQPFSEAYITQRLLEAGNSQPSVSRLWDFLTNEPRPAAVLIPLFMAPSPGEASDSWQVLLTRRTDTVAEHQGQVAFPGGRSDPADTTPEMTALREAREEIGLNPLQVRILGRMNSLQTITNYLVTPVVGVIPWPFPVRLEETEVSRVFSIPLDWLADPDNREIRYRLISGLITRLIPGNRFPVIYFKTYQDELLWGVSAEITVRLVEILYDKKMAGD